MLERGRVVARFAVGVGTPAAPTPKGEFYVRSRLTRYRNGFYGPLAFGTSVRSPSVIDWPGFPQSGPNWRTYCLLDEVV